MPLAVTHILVPLVLVDLVRDHFFKKHRRKLTNNFVILAGVAGLLPDVDLLFDLSSGFFSYEAMGFHRTFTHALWIPIVVFVIALLTYYRNRTVFKVSLMVGFGWLMHIILDGFVLGSVDLFYPFGVILSLNLIPPTEFGRTIVAGLDAIILIVWLLHEEFTHKISDFL